MRLNIFLALQTVSALVSTATAIGPVYQILGLESDQRPFVDLDEGAPFFGVSDKHQRLAHYASPPAETDRHKTIYEVLKDDERFTRLTKAIKFVNGIDDILDDEDAQLTFFAPPDDVLRRPDHGNDSQLSWSSIGTLSQSSIDLPSALGLVEDLESSSFDDKKHDKERCKKILKIIIKALLEYHILPAGAYDEHHLGKNQTYATDLSIPGALGHHPQRIRVQSRVIPPVTIVNYYCRITYGDWKAANGIIHVVDHPLIPPPSVFEALYMFPHFFSTFTSVLQRSNLTSAVDLRYVHGSGWKGADSITVFAPMNHAFDQLPRDLQLYLFSPWGARALKKLLEYHIAPGAVIFTDEVRFEGDDDDDDDDIRPCTCAEKSTDVKEDSNPGLTFGSVARLLQGPGLRSVKGILSSREVITNTTYDVDTLLCNYTVSAQVVKSKITYPFPGPKKPSRYETILFVNDHPVRLGDVPARNGVVHVVRRILNPHCKGGDGDYHHPHHPHGPHHPHDPHDPHHPHKPPHRPHDPHGLGDDDGHDDVCWQDWEKWLPQWAESD